MHFFPTQMFLREKQESFFHHVENMQSKQNTTLLVNLYLSNVYINVKRPPKKYITFYEEVVINLG